MSSKTVFYIITGIVLVFLIQSLRDVSIEFIKSSNQEAQPVLMLPGFPAQAVPGAKADGRDIVNS